MEFIIGSLSKIVKEISKKISYTATYYYNKLSMEINLKKNRIREICNIHINGTLFD